MLEPHTDIAGIDSATVAHDGRISQLRKLCDSTIYHLSAMHDRMDDLLGSHPRLPPAEPAAKRVDGGALDELFDEMRSVNGLAEILASRLSQL